MDRARWGAVDMNGWGIAGSECGVGGVCKRVGHGEAKVSWSQVRGARTSARSGHIGRCPRTRWRHTRGQRAAKRKLSCQTKEEVK